MGGHSAETMHSAGSWPAWLQAPIEQFSKAYQNLVMPDGQIRPYNPGLDQNVAGFTQGQQTGLAGIQDTAQGQPADYQQLLGQVQASARGDYLDPSSNPWLQKTYDAAARGVTDQYQNSVSPGITADALRAGAFGGSAQSELQNQARYGLGQNLDELATGIYGGNYQNERQNQLASQQAMPGLLQAQYDPYQQMFAAGGAQQQQSQAEMDAATRNAGARDEYQANWLDRLGQGYQTALGPASGQTVISSKHGGNSSSWLGK